MADSLNCAVCGKQLHDFKYKAMEKWGITGFLCGQCYEKKLTDHYIAPDRQNITKR